MTVIAWEISHSVETNASPGFAWHYWTNVANWDDTPARFELDGPFATGSYGVTYLPGQAPLRWLIREVIPPKAATIELSLDGAALSFEWQFVGLADGRTRVHGQLRKMKRRVSIRGLNQNHNHDLKNLFKGAAVVASTKPGPFQEFYQALLAKGMRPEMARLTLARKIATIVLIVWKKGVSFDAQYLKPQTV
jgi:hypothetical protein